MIHPSIIEKIQRLLEKGRTQYSIGKEVGVSWSTIKRIATGKRRVYEFTFSEDQLFGGVVLRCPKCGVKAEIPEDGCGFCYACVIRNTKGVRPCSQTALSSDPTRLDLGKETKVRYETMRKQKEKDRRQGILDSI